MAPDRSTGVAPVVRPQTRFLPLLSLAIAEIALIRICQFLWALPISAPFQYDYEEGNILNALLRITQGSTPYPDPHALPNIINPYGPVAYYLLAIPVKLFGLAFLYPRAMILGCAVTIAILFALELRRSTGSRLLGIAFGMAFLSLPNIQDWAWLLRVDLLGILFTTAGLIFFSNRHPERAPCHLEPGRKSESKDLLFWPALFFALGFLVKPTLVAAPAACLFFLLGRRQWREAAKLTGTTAAICGVVLGLFAVVTHGAVITDVFLSHPDPFSFQVYVKGMKLMASTSWPLVLLAAVACAGDFWRRRFSPAILWLILSTLTAVTAGKLGSNYNHFLEWNTALCLAAGLGLHVVMRLPKYQVAFIASIVVVGATALVMVRQPHPLDDVNRDHGCIAAYQWVREKAGPNLLSENVGALVLGDKKVWVSNPFVLAQMVEHAGWSDAELVRMVRERRFDAILTRWNYPALPGGQGAERFSPQLLQAIRDNYSVQPMFQCRDMNMVYRPLTR